LKVFEGLKKMFYGFFSLLCFLDLVSNKTGHKIPTQEKHPAHHSICHIICINYNKTHESH